MKSRPWVYRSKMQAPQAAACVLAAGIASTALAAPITVVNPGFEDVSGEVQQGDFTFGALNGWELYDPTGPGGTAGNGNGGDYFIGTLTPQPDTTTPDPDDFLYFPAGAPEGSRVGIAFNNAGTDVANFGTEYGLEQTLSTNLQANTQYLLEVAVGNIASGISIINGNPVFFELSGFPGYRIDLLAGGEVIASDENSLSTSDPIPDGEFRVSQLSFTSGANPAQLDQALGIRLVNLNVVDANFPGAHLEVDFDDVRLSAVVVPLPAALPLMIFACAGLSLVSRRK